MATILQIDTTESRTSVALSENGKTLAFEEEDTANSHAQKITLFIENVVEKSGKNLKSLNAISINSGPGSYTGLRIGSSTAKGLCLGLGIPLIALNGLEVLTYGILENLAAREEKPVQFCPVLDARRMEVFMAVYDSKLNTLIPSTSKLIDQDPYFHNLPQKTLFFGSGARKLKDFWNEKENAYFDLEFKNSAIYLSELSEKAYQENKFENLIDFEPFYLKEFYSPQFPG